MNKRTIIVISVVGVLALGLLSFIVVKRKNKVGCNDSILFLGNSQTATSDGYVERYIKKCGNTNVTKVAKVGAKSDWILDKYKEELAKGNRYDWVSVMIGGNDIFARKSIVKTKENLEQLFRLVKDSGSKLLVMTSPSKSFYPPTDATHLRLGNELEMWLSENKLINKFIPLTQKTNNQSLFKSDNLHLNSKGQDVVFEELLKKGLK